MRHWVALSWFAIVLVSHSIPVRGQMLPIATDRNTVAITGTLGKTTLSGSLRLTAVQDLVGLTLMVSDLIADAGTVVVPDPIPASAVTIEPKAQWDELATRQSVQVGSRSHHQLKLASGLVN